MDAANGRGHVPARVLAAPRRARALPLAAGWQNCDMNYVPANTRYDDMPYRRSGRSGLQLPAISLGLWQNFGHRRPIDGQRAVIHRAFDLGITHFDLANNYGPPYGAAEENFGRILATDLAAYRDELIISSKAGYDMWPGPYGNWGSRKYLTASLDQSLRRMGLEYVDIFYSHRFDPATPLEETMGALDAAVRQGKALYAGISSYSATQTRLAAAILRDLGTPLLITQPSYSLVNRWIEGGLLDVIGDEGIGCIVFSPLAQGLLTGKYLAGIPAGSRAELADSLSPIPPRRRHAREGSRARRDRPSTRAEPGPDGAGLDPPRSAGHVGAHRCRERRSSSRRTSPRSTRSTSRRPTSARSIVTRPRAASTCGLPPARSSEAAAGPARCAGRPHRRRAAHWPYAVRHAVRQPARSGAPGIDAANHRRREPSA